MPVTGSRRRPVSVAEEKPSESDSLIVMEDSPSESLTDLDSEIACLRGRWELASVFNFLNVFEAVIGDDLKLTAEEIERGLVQPNGSNAQLHIKLLKGIPPVSKTLNGSDAWVTVLCKKLAMWWPWVAEGGIPLTTANGEEISRYKDLDPVNRLLILKALCEIRADQDDVLSHINAGIKSGGISSFRKEKVGVDGNATSYWCDGNPVIGHRLYKEVNKNGLRAKVKGRASDNVPSIHFQWETVATNLEEFRNVVDKLSSSKVAAEIAVAKAIETDTLPIMEKLQKRKERAIKRKERQERLLNDTRVYGTGITRSCRNRRPISYTFDDYDRAIDEAIEVSKKRRPREDQKNERNHDKLRNINSNDDSETGTELQENEDRKGDADMSIDSSDGNFEGSNTSDSGTESDKLLESSNKEDNDDSDNDLEIKSNDDNDHGGRVDDTDEERDNPGRKNLASKHFGSRWSLRLAGNTHYPSVETRNLGTKNRLRQRPMRNSALDHFVPDSEDEDSSGHTNGGTPRHEDLSSVANSEEVSDG